MTDIPTASQVSVWRIGSIGDIWRYFRAPRKEQKQSGEFIDASIEFDAKQLRDIGLARCEMLCDAHEQTRKAYPF
ncbi:hypothetical protein AB2B41_22750 [Marimonas sp. MJW-29]|uniref:DUF1127 domain-containing protein n=1 Tax=Sulfitobacter sediminis TaxID=3234186 RepID=A0ABV3RU05_9RHOB